MMSRPVIWTCAFLYGAFLIAAQIFPSRVLIETLRAFLLSISLAVCIAYARPAVEALFAKRRPDLVEQLTLGIALSWFATTMQSFWSLLWRLSGQPLWMQNNDFNALLIYSLILAATLHITAPGAIHGHIPKANMVKLGLACGAAMLILTLIAFADFDAAPVVETIRPWLEDQNSRPRAENGELLFYP